MSCSRILGIFFTSCSIALTLISLVTDFWMINYNQLAHWGLWHLCTNGGCFDVTAGTDYNDVARAFMILTTVAGFISIFSSCATFASNAPVKRFGSFGALISSLSAVVFLTIAMAVYTGKTVRNVNHDHSVLTYGWSFYIGWAAFPFLCITALCHLSTSRALPAAGYQNV
ncbi:lens fiber membrane intrinsic protein-like [Lissotriton helveticus]